jgi:SM-20-related protein
MNDSFEDLIATYIATNVGISKNFLSNELANNLKQNILSLEKKQLLKTAGTGKSDKLIHNTAIRNDVIYWLDKKNNNEYEHQFFNQIDAFVAYLNKTCYTGITGYEFHYTLYEKGSFYRKHLDQFQDNTSRQFSMISYLNDNWQDGDGGELLIHELENNIKISPTQGKTVFFKSNELVHEVLETQERRLSITGWLKRD